MLQLLTTEINFGYVKPKGRKRGGKRKGKGRGDGERRREVYRKSI